MAKTSRQRLSLDDEIGEDRWTIGNADSIQAGTKVRAGNGKGGRARGQDLRAAAIKLDQQVAMAVNSHRSTPQYDRIHASRRALAKTIATELGLPLATVRTRLARLKLR